jgi:prepilin-type N-terminal cleavage/methylation domain-containing protein
MPSSCQRTVSGASILLVHPTKLPLRGFSLVELAIVLVVLGLLVGGVLSGRSLIRAAELRNVTSESQKYIAATKSFRDKYFALPGDMNNASQFWGLRVAGVACGSTPSTDARTCDGDGNGRIDMLSANSREWLRYWQHLANAGLIEGSYDGVGAIILGSVSDRQHGISRLAKAEWDALWVGTITGLGTLFDGDYANAIYQDVIGSANGGVLSPQEAWHIDNKQDDGMPATGIIVVTPFLACTTAVASSTLTAAYQLTETPNTCSLIYRRQL